MSKQTQVAPDAPAPGAQAPRADLAHFFAPRSVALVGATDDRSRFAGKVLKRGLTGYTVPP
jgi:hypothetical protein